MEWIDVNERLPPNDCYVLVATWDGRPKVEMFFINIAKRMNDFWYDDHYEELYDPKYAVVKHWMPLPDKPKNIS